MCRKEHTDDHSHHIIVPSQLCPATWAYCSELPATQKNLRPGLSTPIVALFMLTLVCRADASPACPGCEGKTLRAKSNFDAGDYPQAERDLDDVVKRFESESDSPSETAPYSIALQNLGLLYYFE